PALFMPLFPYTTLFRSSDPGYRRPLLVIQSNDFTDSAIRTVVSVPITSNTKLAAAPGNVLLSRKSTGLAKDSVANVSQVFPANRSEEHTSELQSRVDLV